MTTFEFQNQIVNLNDFIQHFAMKFTRDSDKAKDLAQETMLKAFSNYDKFRTNTNLKGWLRVIMRNIFINGYRKKINTVIKYNSDDFNVQQGQADNYSPDHKMMKDEIQGFINSLNDEVRIPFEMHCAGFKYQEIMDSMNLPIGTIKSRIFQARKLLAQKINHA